MNRFVLVPVALTAGGLGLLLACTPAVPPSQPTIQAAATQVAPTVQAAATQVAPTVQAERAETRATAAAVQPTAQAAATALAPTAQAVATHVAPTVQAVASQAVAAAATSVAISPVQITSVMVDPTDTQIAIRNSGSNSVNLRNWTLLIGPTLALTLPEFELAANQTRTLHLAPGTTTDSDVYLGFGSGLVSHVLGPDDRVVLVSSREEVASIYRPT
jgi:hypothetical protein